MQKEALLYKKLENSKVQCLLCSHKCVIKNSDFGFCTTRQNKNGILYNNLYGIIAAANTDPIEKKPLYHFLPKSISFSIASYGCNFKCSFCQNWRISQENKPNDFKKTYSPEKIAEEAFLQRCKSISYTYTEPTVFFEYALDTAKAAKRKGLYNIFVTNGYMTKKAVELMALHIDAANVDLKFFNKNTYRKICKASLNPVLESIINMKEKGIWLEITTLIIPGLNDSKKELACIAGFIAEIDKNIPWHISRFFPGYKYTKSEPTPLKTLLEAGKIGKEAGLNYVYTGNTAGKNLNDTLCPSCKEIIIKRENYNTEIKGLDIQTGTCKKCKTPIKGIWKKI